MTKMMSKKIALIALGLAALSACSPYKPTEKADYSIKVQENADGTKTAVAPGCPTWAASVENPYDNQPIPQFGCANARNLALMVENPQDLVKGREMGPASGVTTVGAVRRYNNNQTRGLLDLDSSPDMSVAVTSSASATSSMTGEAAGSGGAAAAPAAAAAAP